MARLGRKLFEETYKDRHIEINLNTPLGASVLADPTRPEYLATIDDQDATFPIRYCLTLRDARERLHQLIDEGKF